MAKWSTVLFQTKWVWIWILLLSLKFQIWCLREGSSLAFRQTIECRFTLKLVRDIIITYSQMHRTDQFPLHNSIIKPVWLNGWVFDYELSGCRFESRCCHSKYLSCLYFNNIIPFSILFTFIFIEGLSVTV